MKFRSIAMSVLSVALVVALAHVAVGDVIVNGGFETPVYSGTPPLQSDPNGTGWDFTIANTSSGEAGILPNDATIDWGATAIDRSDKY